MDRMNILTKWLIRHQKVLLIFFVFLVCCSVRLYRFADKDTMYCDEFLSVTISSYSDYGWSLLVQTGEDGLSGREMTQLVFEDDNSVHNVILDIWYMWKNVRDIDHTNLYYSLFRITQLGGDLTDFDDVMWRGFLLNLLFFCVGFIFMFKLLRLFVDDMFIIAVVLLTTFLLPVGVAETLFVREYQMQEMFFIILTYLFVKFSFRIQRQMVVFEKKGEVLFFAMSVAFALHSGYFGTIYVFLLGIVMLLLMLLYKNNARNIISLFVSGVVALIVTLIIYPRFFLVFLYGRSEGVLARVANFAEFGVELNASLNELSVEVSNYYMELPFFVVLFCLGVFSSFCLMKKDDRFVLPLIIVGLSLFWGITVFYLAPYKFLRYISAVFPLYSLLIVALLLSLNKVVVRKALGILIVVLAFCQFGRKTDVYWGYVDIYERYKELAQYPLVIDRIGVSTLDAALAPLYMEHRMIYTAFSEDQTCKVIDKHPAVCLFTSRSVPSLPKGYEVVEEVFYSVDFKFYCFKIEKTSSFLLSGGCKESNFERLKFVFEK